MSQVLLEAENIYYAYAGASEAILKGVSLTLEREKVVAITGHSGSGKSTLLHILAGMIAPASGTIHISGKALQNQDQSLQKHLFGLVGMIFQEFHVIPYLTVEENMLMGGMFLRNNEERCGYYLEKIGLTAFRNQPVGALSGGQKQRVAIGRALMKGAQVLLADEPTGNLDEATAQDILNLFQTLAKEEGCGVCFVTHEPSGVATADEVYHLQAGQLKKTGDILS